jgi:hypothetical protein
MWPDSEQRAVDLRTWWPNNCQPRGDNPEKTGNGRSMSILQAVGRAQY